jgi:hypothetical protein
MSASRTVFVAIPFLLLLGCGDDGPVRSLYNIDVGNQPPSDTGGETSECGEYIGACLNPADPSDPDSRASCAEYRGATSIEASAFQAGCEQGEETTWHPGPERCATLDSSLNFGCEVPTGTACVGSWGEVEADELANARSACESSGGTPVDG